MTGKVEILLPKDGARPEMSDEELVTACGKGDRAALGILFRKYNPDVHRFITVLMGEDQPTIDDLVQDTFLGVRAGSKRFTGASQVRSWIFGIAANVVRNAIRTKTRRKKAADNYEKESHASPDNPLIVAERRDRLTRVQAAINKLTHDQRAVLVMCVFEEVPGTEAARLLGLPPGTLWRRLHEARKSLAHEMEKSQA